MQDLEAELKALREENARLQERSKMFDTVLSSFPGHVYWLDREGVYQGCNQQQAESFGLASPEDVIGLTNAELTVGGQAEQLDRTNEEVMRSGKAWEKEEFCVFVGVAGTYYSRKMPIIDGLGNTIGLLGVSLDITHIKYLEAELAIEKEAAEAAAKAKAEFIMNISHDIRTPFSGILSIAEILHKNSDNQADRNLLEMIVQSGKNLMALLNGVIKAIAEDKSNLECDKSIFSVQALLERCSVTFSGEIRRKGIGWQVFCDPQLPKSLIGEEEVLDRILINLVGNAIKFTHAGSVNLSAKQHELTEDTVMLELEVADEGIGIPDDKLATIFEKFNRVTPSYQQRYQGAGLGLWIVKQFINKLGGQISVRSVLGEGTTFTCLIPLKIANVTEQASMPSQVIVPASSRLPMTEPPRHILLLEDDPIAQVAELLLLQDSFNAHITTAETVAEAKQLLKSNEYDCLFLDIGLPDGSGEEVAVYAKDVCSPGQSLPVLIGLSAHVSAEKNKELLTCFDKVLLKPLSYELCQELVAS